MANIYALSGRMQTIRDCIEGQDRIKHLSYRYLPHPSTLVTSSTTLSDDQTARYTQFIQYAEFDDAPAQTLKASKGKLRLHQATVSAPESVEALMDDIDGDGTTFNDQLEFIASEIMQMKYAFCVVDYQGLTGVDTDNLSIAAAENINSRSVIKTYTRDSIISVVFRKVNGIKKLAYVELYEEEETDQITNKATVDEEVKSATLVLALDEEGYYYQERLKEEESSGRNYITVSGQRLSYIPGLFLSDEPVFNALSEQLGFLYPICLKAIAKYQVSAVYKECMRALVPTVYTTGWSHGDKELFSDVNQGRDYISTSPTAVNNLPDGVTADVKSVNGELQYFENYFQKVDEQIEHLGGVSTSGEVVKTATEADIDAVERNAVLMSIASNIESGYTKLLEIAAIFEGVTGDIEVSLFKDFATPKLTSEELQRLIELRNNNLLSTDEVMRKLDQSGFLIESIETVLAELENISLIGDGITDQ